MGSNRKYTTEFKIAAVRRWEEIGNFNEVGRELDITPSLIRRWRDQLRDEGEQAFPGKGQYYLLSNLLFLAVVLDVFDRQIVGWAMDNHNVKNVFNSNHNE